MDQSDHSYVEENIGSYRFIVVRNSLLTLNTHAEFQLLRPMCLCGLI